MIYAKIENGIVVNAVVSDVPFGDYNIELPSNAGIGYTFADGIFTPPAPPAPPAPTQADYSNAVQSHLDTAARGYGYDTIASACTYADEPIVATFQAEGQAFRAWRSLVWMACITIKAAVDAQTRTQPTIAELIAELPTFTPPA